LAAKLDQMVPEDTIQQNVFLPLIHSIVERQRGDAAKAADLLARAEPYDFTLDVHYQRAQAYLAAGDSSQAIAELQKLLDRRGAGWWQTYAPLAQLGIARAYAMQGDRENSRKAYDEFFTTWKDADPHIPILLQAKSEYKKISATTSAAASAAGKSNGHHLVSADRRAGKCKFCSATFDQEGTRRGKIYREISACASVCRPVIAGRPRNQISETIRHNRQTL
jgi:tetratricopeptide (TPR) repeat protein